MQNPVLGLSLVFVLAAGLAACGDDEPRMPPGMRGEEWHGPIEILRRYAGPDGRLTRQQLEEGLHRDFAAADSNHDGVLQPDEMRAVNQARWKEDQSAVSPLQDWNGDGVIDFNEFAATARALFRDADRDGNGVLTPDELRLPAKATTPAANDPATPPQGHRGHRQGG